MALSSTQRRIILKAIYDKILSSGGIDHILPSPQKFVDVADFWALNNPKLTQKEIETTPIVYCVISRPRFEDENPIEEGCEDNPLTYYNYRFRLFHQHFETRMDETDAPDDFLKRINQSYELFLDAIDSLKAVFQGIQPVEGFPTDSVNLTSLIQENDNEDIVFSNEFNEGAEVTGFYTDLICKVEVLI